MLIGKSKRLSGLTHFMFTFPALVLYLVFFIFPVLLGAYYSLTNWDGISKKYSFIGLGNYVRIFHDERLLNSVVFNLKYSVFLILFITSIALGIALLINSKIKFKSFFKAVYFFPAVLSLITVGLIWNEVFYRVIPIIGKALGIGFLSQNILSSPKTAIYGILIVNVWQGVSIPIILFLAGLQSIPEELYEALKMDGANAFHRFKYITLPFLIPVINIVFISNFKGGLMVFDYIIALTGGGPGHATESIAILMYNHAFTERRFAYSVAESVILCVVIAGISLLQNALTKNKEVYE